MGSFKACFNYDERIFKVASNHRISGCSNANLVSLGFRAGDNGLGITIKPRNSQQPIILAISNDHRCWFVRLDQHLTGETCSGAIKVPPWDQPNESVVIDCGHFYWAVHTDKDAFVYSAPGAANDLNGNCQLLPTAHPLCSFLAGDLSENQLRAMSWRHRQRQRKADNKSNLIKHLIEVIRNHERNYEMALAGYNRLQTRLLGLCLGRDLWSRLLPVVIIKKRDLREMIGLDRIGNGH